jgi:hypothetical protein
MLYLLFAWANWRLVADRFRLNAWFACPGKAHEWLFARLGFIFTVDEANVRNPF